MSSSTMNGVEVTDRRGTLKFLSVVFGYMFIALAITAATTFGFAFWFANLIVSNADNAAGIIITTMIVSGIAMLITSVVMSLTMFKQMKGAWVPFLLYAAIMGVFMSTFVMWIDAYTIGTAFGVTALVFLVMFCIGYFTKVSLSPLAFIALGLLWTVILVSIPFGIIYLVSPTAALLMNYGISLICAIAMMLIVGWDANRMSRDIQNGYVTKNLALYYASEFYSDFIMIFIHLLYLLAMAKSNN